MGRVRFCRGTRASRVQCPTSKRSGERGKVRDKNKGAALSKLLFLDRFKAKLEALAFPAGVEPTTFRLGVIDLGKSNFYIVKYR